MKTILDGRELVIRLCAQYDMLQYAQQIIALTFAAYSHLNKRILKSVTVHISLYQDYWVDINIYKPDKINYQKFYLVALAITEKFKIYSVEGVYNVFSTEDYAYREISSGALKKRGKEAIEKLSLIDF